MRPYRAIATLVVLFLAAGPAHGDVRAGQTLQEALHELEDSGLRFVFSDALVRDDMVLQATPRRAAAAQVAASVLADFGLELLPVQPGVYAVVRRSGDGTDDRGAIELLLASRDGLPLEQARARLDPGAHNAAADARGVIRIDGLGPDRYDITVTLSGADTVTLRGVALHAGQTLRVPIILNRIAAVLEEVSVYASRYRVDTRRPMSVATLTHEDLESLPGISQDALRTVRYLPGTASNGLSARTHVRGGRQDETAVYLDGVPLSEPFHFKDFQGLLGVIDPGAVEQMDFYSGVLPLRFGERLSGVIDIVPRQASEPRTYELGISPLYASALATGRSPEAGLSWLGSMRVSTVAALINALERRVGEPQFLDAYARGEWRVDERRRLTAGWLLLDDRLEIDLASTGERAAADYRDATGYLRAEFDASERLALRALVARTERHTNRSGTLARAGGTNGALSDDRLSDISIMQLAASWRAAKLRMTTGLEARSFDAHYEVEAAARFDPLVAQALGQPPGFARSARQTNTGRTWGLHVNGTWSPLRALMISAGARWDAQRYGAAHSDSQVSPRIHLEYSLGSATKLRAAIGRMHQATRPEELQFADGETTFSRAQQATLAVLGLEQRLSRDAGLRLEIYNKRTGRVRATYENLLDPVSALPELEADRVRVAPLASRSYGTELTVRWEPRTRWGAWLSYSFAESKDVFAGFSAPRTWDQRHGLASGGSWTSHPWQVSATVNWHSGWRRNELSQSGGNGSPLVTLLPRNASAWDPFLSIDLRASWSRSLRHGVLRLYADLSNATNHANLCCSAYQLRPGNPLERSDSTLAPRYILAGANWAWP